MALVVFLRGVNVGGHKTFRPAALAQQLADLGAVNIGAAGTFVIRRRISRAAVRTEFARRLPFETQIAMCDGREILGLLSRDFFSKHAARPDIVRFVSVMCGPPRGAPRTPATFPSTGEWLVKVLARENRLLVGMYRRHMKAISCLTTLDRVFGVPLTTRNWNTMTAIGEVLSGK